MSAACEAAISFAWTHMPHSHSRSPRTQHFPDPGVNHLALFPRASPTSCSKFLNRLDIVSAKSSKLPLELKCHESSCDSANNVTAALMILFVMLAPPVNVYKLSIKLLCSTTWSRSTCKGAGADETKQCTLAMSAVCPAQTNICLARGRAPTTKRHNSVIDFLRRPLPCFS